MYIYSRAIRGKGGGLLSLFLKTKESALTLEDKAMIMSMFGLDFPFKM